MNEKEDRKKYYQAHILKFTRRLKKELTALCKDFLHDSEPEKAMGVYKATKLVVRIMWEEVNNDKRRKAEMVGQEEVGGELRQ